MRARLFLSVMSLALAAAPAAAKVHEQSDRGFVVRIGTEVPATPEESWAVLVQPGQWWSDAQTFSRKAENLSLDPRAGGCFCEVLPNEASARAAPKGSVEHMRVIYAEEPRALRMTGGIGPLQSEAVNATLTIFLKPADGKTQVLWEYVVSGYFRESEVAPQVDRILTGQLVRLATKLGAAPAGDADDDEPGEAAPDADADEPEADQPTDAGAPFDDAFADEPATAPNRDPGIGR